MEASRLPTLHVLAPAEVAPLFAPLLRQGVGVWVPGPRPVRDFLVEDMGLGLHYAIHSVPGLFVNGVAVDDWDHTLVAPGDVVALSGTMPGLAGIALRRQSPLKSFRQDLTAPFRASEVPAGTVLVRPFNFVAQDAALPLLARGICLSGVALAAFVAEREEALRCCRVLPQERSLVDVASDWRQAEQVLLQVEWHE
jgi:hypothetical protein